MLDGNLKLVTFALKPNWAHGADDSKSIAPGPLVRINIIRAYSSTAEQSAHNALVAGSNPAGPTF